MKKELLKDYTNWYIQYFIPLCKSLKNKYETKEEWENSVMGCDQDIMWTHFYSSKWGKKYIGVK